MKDIIKYLRKIIPHNSPIRLWYTRLLQYYTFKTDRLDIDDMQLIGVTGTDGKTTTVEMIAHILNELNIPYLSTSSLEAKINGKVITTSKRTTPSLRALHALLRQAKNKGARVAVIEVSSHALAQWRVLGLKFDVSVLTNITHEHLNFHKTQENYANTKKLLFTKYLKQFGTTILPTNDEYGSNWIKEFGNIALPYSPQNTCPITDKYGTAFVYKDAQYQIPMLGSYNAGNAIAAALAVSSLKTPKPGFGITTEDALLALGNFTGIAGRMQIVSTPKPGFGVDVTCIVDFALTERAMSSALATCREVAGGANTANKVIVVFGASGGQHDASVHPGLAKAAAQGADVCIVTDDEPYDGDPAEIRANLIKYIKETSKLRSRTPKSPKFEYYNIADRREAIQKALALATDGDVIMMSGMGHYTSRTVNGMEVPWNDAEVLHEMLNTSK